MLKTRFRFLQPNLFNWQYARSSVKAGAAACSLYYLFSSCIHPGAWDQNHDKMINLQDEYFIVPNRSMIETTQTEREWIAHIEECRKDHKQLEKKLDPTLNAKRRPFSGDYRLNMRGVGLIAAHIARKLKLEKKLFVCESIQAFQSELEKIASQSGNQKCVFIIPSAPYEVDPNREQNTHKIAIGVQKENRRLSIVMFDPLTDHSHKDYLHTVSKRDFNQPNLRGAIDHWGAYYGGVAVKTIMHSRLSDVDCTVFSSSMKRQHTGRGCFVFALQDALQFLRDPDFIHRIMPTKLEVINSSFKVANVVSFPPEVMISTQSRSTVSKYVRLCEKHKKPSKLGKWLEPLEGMDITDAIGLHQDGNKKNRFVDALNVQYSKMLSYLLSLPPEEIAELERTTLIRDRRIYPDIPEKVEESVF